MSIPSFQVNQFPQTGAACHLAYAQPITTIQQQLYHIRWKCNCKFVIPKKMGLVPPSVMNARGYDFNTTTRMNSTMQLSK